MACRWALRLGQGSLQLQQPAALALQIESVSAVGVSGRRCLSGAASRGASHGLPCHWGWLMCAGAAGGFGLQAMAASWGVHQPTTALAEGVPPALLDEADRLKRLHDWLKASGADMSLVEVRQSQAGAGAGYGMFVASGSDTKQLKRCTLSASRRRWWWPFGGSGGSLVSQAPLATFPMSRAVTAHNILRDEKLGRGYGWMLEHGVVDERTIIMAFLVVERLKGSASHLAPWIDALPTTFDTPLAFSPAELAELAGTPLHRASAVVAGRLREQWARMQPALSGLLQSQPGVARQATYDDLLWAYSVFWSRGQSLPVPARAGASSSSLLAADKDAAAHALLDVHEGIVPGLDFCNHHTATPECWWEVATPAEGGEGAAPDVGAAVQLRLYRGAGASPGDELRISYGDKSNEELLLLYGFAVQGNPHDHIMVHVPLPPSSMWDEVMHARVALLRSAGHDLQFFLPSPFPLAKGAAGSVPKGGSASPAGAGAGVPRGLLQTLEVFVLTPAELTQRLEALKRASAGRPADGDAELLQPVDLADIKRQRARMGAQELADSADRLGVRMGAVAAGVKILEHRVEELESAPQAAGSGGGSGSLEEDDALLAQWASEPRAAAAALPATERRRRACVIYRREQKAITREYLKRTRAELSDVLGTLQVERAQQRLAGKVSGLATDMSRRMDRIMSALESMGAGGGGGGDGGAGAASMRHDNIAP
ncbi:hypothetical protein FOA52_000023 [Chlamydomonas sp. UWO 241]|nr:hypothetical protein FOA52_000023 [Chlamydomonas sp. UWO 241]